MSTEFVTNTFGYRRNKASARRESICIKADARAHSKRTPDSDKAPEVKARLEKRYATELEKIRDTRKQISFRMKKTPD